MALTVTPSGLNAGSSKGELEPPPSNERLVMKLEMSVSIPSWKWLESTWKLPEIASPWLTLSVVNV